MPNVKAGNPENPAVAGRVSVWHRKKGLTSEADWKEFGNIIDPNIAVEIERLAHLSTRRGTRAKDREVISSRSGRLTFKIDELNKSNLQFVFGSKQDAEDDTLAVNEGKIVDNPGGTGTVELGESEISSVIVRSISEEDTEVTYEDGVDYTVDLANGILTVLNTGDLNDATLVPRFHVFFQIEVETQSFEGFDGSEIEGEVKFQCLTPEGLKWAAVAKNTSVRTNGDISIGDGGTWQEMSISIEFLEDTNGELVRIHLPKAEQIND